VLPSTETTGLCFSPAASTVLGTSSFMGSPQQIMGTPELWTMPARLPQWVQTKNFNSFMVFSPFVSMVSRAAGRGLWFVVCGEDVFPLPIVLVYPILPLKSVTTSPWGAAQASAVLQQPEMPDRFPDAVLVHAGGDVVGRRLDGRGRVAHGHPDAGGAQHLDV